MQTIHRIPSLKSLGNADMLAVVPEESIVPFTASPESVNEFSMKSESPLLTCQDSNHDTKLTEPSSSFQPLHFTVTNSTDSPTPSSDLPITSAAAMETQTNQIDAIALSNQSSGDLDPGSRRSTAADSIKRLYDLTITESWKQRNEAQLNTENRATSPPGQRALWTKTNSEQAHLLTHQLPLSLRDKMGLRPRSMTLNLDEPQLYVNDLVPILDERNALKLRVFQLEEELSKQRKLANAFNFSSPILIIRHTICFISHTTGSFPALLEDGVEVQATQAHFVEAQYPLCLK